MCELEAVLPTAEQEEGVDEAIWHLGETDEFLLRSLIENHFRVTGSLRARMLLDNWPAMRAKFVKVFPQEYRRALQQMTAVPAPAGAQKIAA
jgi:glutamate synthase (NADPH/NADH) large chain